MQSTYDRAQFLRRGAAGGLALVGGSSVLAMVSGPALAQSGAPSDTDIAKLAATAELLAIDFYTHSITSRKFKGDDLKYLHQARKSEQEHYAALAGVIGSGAPKGLKFKYPAHTFASRKSIAATGVALETAFVGAYLGAVTALSSNELKGVAAQIATSEASHLSVFSDLASGKPILPSFPKAFTAAQATKAVTPFIAG